MFFFVFMHSNTNETLARVVFIYGSIPRPVTRRLLRPPLMCGARVAIGFGLLPPPPPNSFPVIIGKSAEARPPIIAAIMMYSPPLPISLWSSTSSRLKSWIETAEST